MKRVGAGRASLVTAAAVWLLALACTVFGAWALASGWQETNEAVLASVGVAPGRERLVYALGVLLFGAFAVYYAYAVFYKGIGCILYNEEMVVFVFNRRERRSYRWQDLRPGGVMLRRLGDIEPGAVLLLEGYFFEFPDGRRMPVRAVLKGYREFEDLLVRKGFLAQVYR